MLLNLLALSKGCHTSFITCALCHPVVMSDTATHSVLRRLRNKMFLGFFVLLSKFHTDLSFQTTSNPCNLLPTKHLSDSKEEGGNVSKPEANTSHRISVSCD